MISLDLPGNPIHSDRLQAEEDEHAVQFRAGRHSLGCRGMTDKPDEQQAPDPGAAGAAGQSADPADDFVTTHHVITVDGEQLPYTATAGRVVLRQEGHTEDKFDGPKARAEVFMTAYTLGDGAATRPVTFAFNGGPGSSSVWLHLGLLGPRRVLSGDVGALLPPPYDIADNHQTLLRRARAYRIQSWSMSAPQTGLYW
jgi:carboxypeptidase C (cathepsin A)